MWLTLYKSLGRIAPPLIGLWLDRRARRGKEDPARQRERFGYPGRPRPDGPLVWVHAASVGESLSILPLVVRVLALDPRVTVMVTTGTVTSAKLMAERLPPRAFHQYIPVDLPGAARRFLDHWRPDLVLWTESEFWPVLLDAIARSRIPAALLNGRISERSARNWRRLGGGGILRCFDVTIPQSQAAAELLSGLGLRGVTPPVNLKYAAEPLPADMGELDRLRALIGARPTIVYASTHGGEEALAGHVHQALKLSPGLDGLLTIIVPRHPARGPDIAAQLRAMGLSISLRSKGGLPEPEIDAYVADTMGELGLFYRMSPVAVIGGSFVPLGGHNPLEPALLGAAVLHGPDMSNFPDIATALSGQGAMARVAGEGELVATLRHLLGNPAECAARAAAGHAVAAGHARAIDDVMLALGPLLARAGIGREHMA